MEVKCRQCIKSLTEAVDLAHTMSDWVLNESYLDVAKDQCGMLRELIKENLYKTGCISADTFRDISDRIKKIEKMMAVSYTHLTLPTKRIV